MTQDLNSTEPQEAATIMGEVVKQHVASVKAALVFAYSAMILGFILLLALALIYCRRRLLQRAAKHSLPLPTPPICRRQLSFHTVYPPTPPLVGRQQIQLSSTICRPTPPVSPPVSRRASLSRSSSWENQLSHYYTSLYQTPVLVSSHTTCTRPRCPSHYDDHTTGTTPEESDNNTHHYQDYYTSEQHYDHFTPRQCDDPATPQHQDHTTAEEYSIDMSQHQDDHTNRLAAPGRPHLPPDP